MPIIESPADEVSSDTAELIADLELLPKHFTETGVIERLVTQLTQKDLALTAAQDDAKPKREAALAEYPHQIAKGSDAAHDDTRALIARASVEYTKWHDSDPVIGEEDSISHEYVREIVPELIEALVRVQAALERANHDAAAQAAKIAAGPTRKISTSR